MPNIELFYINSGNKITVKYVDCKHLLIDNGMLIGFIEIAGL